MAGRIPITINRGTSERRIFAKTIAITGRLLLRDRQLKRFFDLMNLKKGLVVEARGGALRWRTGFGWLDCAHTMRFVAPGATLIALGFQTALAGFFSVPGMH
jgi:hypothetical protein